MAPAARNGAARLGAHLLARFHRRLRGAVRPRTFLYEEERILHLRARARGHETWYDPSLVVWHRTRARDYKATAEYWAWRRDIKIRSLEVVLAVMAELRRSTA